MIIRSKEGQHIKRVPPSVPPQKIQAAVAAVGLAKATLPKSRHHSPHNNFVLLRVPCNSQRPDPCTPCFFGFSLYKPIRYLGLSR